MSHQQDQQLIAKLLSLPNALIIVNKVSNVLENERQRREQFYNEISEFEKAEFINGEIIIHSPVKKEHHDVASGLFKLIDCYVLTHNLGFVGYDKIMINLTRNDYEPDICFFNQEKAKDFKKEQSLFPAPDLVVEVLSKKTKTNDRGIKFDDYEAHQILEYWIIDPQIEMVEQYRLNKTGAYELILKANKGTIECFPIQGFILEIEAIFDKEKNLEMLRNILAPK